MRRIEVRPSGNDVLPFRVSVRPDADNPTYISILVDYHELEGLMEQVSTLMKPDAPIAETQYAEAYSKGWSDAMDAVEHGA